jgi:diadenosine tetraphosphatase ApaH/serine/threonine PP2A family protein phosphatase
MKDPEGWARRLEGIEADIVCVGHSHMQFNLMTKGVVVLNPGSVGQPRDGDPRAAYAIIDNGRIELKRIEYPIDRAIAAMDATDLPDRAKQLYAHGLRHGRLDAPADPGDAAG